MPRGASLTPDALEPVDAGVGTQVVRGQVGVVDHALDPLERGQDLDQPGVVVEERRGDRAVEPVAELLELLVGQGRAHVRADVEPGQRADAVDAVGVAQRLVVGRLEVGVGLDRLADVLLVARGIDLVGDDLAAGVDEAELAIVMLPGPVLGDQAHEQRGEVAEADGLLVELIEDAS